VAKVVILSILTKLFFGIDLKYFKNDSENNNIPPTKTSKELYLLFGYEKIKSGFFRPYQFNE